MAGMAMTIFAAIAFAVVGKAADAIQKATSPDPNAERKRHDKALEKFEKDNEEYRRRKRELENWEMEREKLIESASEKFELTDEALKYYNSTRPDFDVDDKAPEFADYYEPSDGQKKGELILLGGGMLVAGYLVNRFI